MRKKKPTVLRPVAYDLTYGPETAALKGMVMMRIGFKDTGQILCELNLPAEEFLRWANTTRTVADRVELDLYGPVHLPAQGSEAANTSGS